MTTGGAATVNSSVKSPKSKAAATRPAQVLETYLGDTQGLREDNEDHDDANTDGVNPQGWPDGLIVLEILVVVIIFALFDLNGAPVDFVLLVNGTTDRGADNVDRLCLRLRMHGMRHVGADNLDKVSNCP